MSEILAFTTDNFENEVLKAEGLVLVDFYATWCSHSKRLDAVLREAVGLYAGRVKMGKVDVFKDNPLSQKYRILSTPTVVFFRNGEEAARMVGSGVRDHLKEKIEELLAS